VKPARISSRSWLPITAALIGGLALGVAAGLLAPVLKSRLADDAPRTLTVGATGIGATLSQAHSGDTVLIPEGRYREKIELREGVTLRAAKAFAVTLISPDGAPPVSAHNVETAALEGVWIQADPQAPAMAGIELVNSSPSLLNVWVTGAGAGIRITGNSAPLIKSGKIANNLGPGFELGAGSKPRIESNLIAANGNGTPTAPKPGVEVQDQAKPVLKDNAIVDNAAEPVWIHGHTWQPADYQENFFGGLAPKKAARLVDEPPPAPAKKGRP
jgi:hypothetical protein